LNRFGGESGDRTPDLITARVHYPVIAGYRKVSESCPVWTFAFIIISNCRYIRVITGILLP